MQGVPKVLDISIFIQMYFLLKMEINEYSEAKDHFHFHIFL